MSVNKHRVRTGECGAASIYTVTGELNGSEIDAISGAIDLCETGKFNSN